MRTALAVSGGADSIALMLHAARNLGSDQIIALSVDHGTRPASRIERDHACAVASHLGIPFRTLTPVINGSGHASWREARFTCMTDYCAREGIQRLWLGHHADDAAETAAIRLLAGGPLHGLAGISASGYYADIRIERPLLRLSGRAIRRQVMASGFGWAEDPSNRNLAYKRSAIRRTLAASPDTAKAHNALIHRAGLWRVRWEKLVQAAWESAAELTPYGAIMLRWHAVEHLPISLRGYLLRRAATAVTGDAGRLRNVDFASAAQSAMPGTLGGAVIEDVHGDWCIARNAASIGPPVPLAAEMTWDNRARLMLTAKPPAGNWSVVAVNGYRIGAIATLAPASALDALPAIAGCDGVVAIPHLGIWRGRHGPFWAEHLRVSWNRTNENGTFELAR